MVRLLLFAIILYLICVSPALSINDRINYAVPGCYTGAAVSWETFNDGQKWEVTLRDMQEFERLAGKKLAFVMHFVAFKFGEHLYDFPDSLCRRVYKNDSIPVITWFPYNWDTQNPENAQISMLPDILKGKYDIYLESWALSAKSLGKPLLIRFAPEMNCQTFTWNGLFNGRNKKNGFGDPKQYDGPETYVAAYRYVHDIFQGNGCNNVIWFWCPNAIDYPKEDWNKYYLYYPGDNYADIIGFDGFNWGSTQPWSNWQSFSDIFGSIYNDMIMRYPNKPLAIGEFSSVEEGGSKSSWSKDALDKIRGPFNHIKLFTWVHYNNKDQQINGVLEHSDWRINSSDKSLEAFRTAIINNYFKSKVVLNKDTSD